MTPLIRCPRFGVKPKSAPRPPVWRVARGCGRPTHVEVSRRCCVPLTPLDPGARPFPSIDPHPHQIARRSAMAARRRRRRRPRRGGSFAVPSWVCIGCLCGGFLQLLNEHRIYHPLKLRRQGCRGATSISSVRCRGVLLLIAALASEGAAWLIHELSKRRMGDC